MVRTALVVIALAAGVPAAAKPVTITAADGVTLSAEADGAGERGVVLVHDKGRNAADWAPLVSRLGAEGFRTVAVDLRGHGGSKIDTPIADDGWSVGVADVTAAIGWMRAKGATEISVVGAGLGANLGLVAASADPAVNTVVMVDAGLNLDGVKLPTPVAEYGTRPLLFVVSAGNDYTSRTAELLVPRVKGPNHVQTVSGATNLSTLLSSDPELASVVISWLNGTFFLSEGELDKARSGLNTGDTSGIQTTGKKFGE